MNVKDATDADPWTDINFDDPDLQRLLDEPLKLDNSVLRVDEHFSGFDNNVGENWIYPSNMPLRCYQYNITHNALYRNTLVVLPTGLGKTFIAAVVMYNLYRWYPTGKVIFMAPTRPLVAQQIEACQRVMPFPHEDTIELTGKLNKKVRMELWQSKRVFFATPQVVQSDIANVAETGEESNFPFAQVKLIVFDEAHKARGRYAYTEVSQTLWRHNRYFRVLALSATPGRTMEDVADVVRNLFISHLEVRCDNSIDVCPYIHKRTMSTVVVKLSPEMQALRDELLAIIDPYLRQLIDADVLSGSLTNINRNWLLYEQKRFRERSMHQRHPQQSAVTTNFSICISLYHALDLLERHGMRVFLNNFENDEDGKAKFVVAMDRRLRDLIENVRSQVGPNPFDVSANAMTNGQIAEIPADLDFGHPKFEKARSCLLEHFENKPDSRAIVFCEYRESVMLIYRLLLQHRPLLKPRCFVGQGGSTGSLRALSQKQQIQIMSDFRSGTSNILIATCIGEEGIDVGEVDLIVCFDISTTNPTRFIQRIGRTGRQKQGAVVMLVTAGKEQALLKDVLSNKDQTNKKLARSTVVAAALYKSAPRMVPSEFNPQCVKTYIKLPEAKAPVKKTKDKKISIKEKKSTKSNVLPGSQDLRKFFKKPPVVELEPADMEVFALNEQSKMKKKKPTQPVGLNTQITLNSVDSYFEDLDISYIMPATTQTQKGVETKKSQDSEVATTSKSSQVFNKFDKKVTIQIKRTNLEDVQMVQNNASNAADSKTIKRQNSKNTDKQQLPSNVFTTKIDDFKKQSTMASAVGLPKLVEENLSNLSKFYEELGMSFNESRAEVNNDSESDEAYQERIEILSDTSESKKSEAKSAPLSESELVEQLKSSVMPLIAKRKILDMNFKFVHDSVQKMKQLLRWFDDSSNSSDDESSLPLHEAEIRANYHLVVSILGNEDALQQFLKDTELKDIDTRTFSTENPYSDEDERDNIFGHVEESNLNYKKKLDEHIKQEELAAKAKSEETARQLDAQSMVYETMRHSSDDLASMQLDEASLRHEDFSITDSKYCSQWDEFANQEVKHKSTPLQVAPRSYLTKKPMPSTSPKRVCNLVEVMQANPQFDDDDDDDVIFLEQLEATAKANESKEQAQSLSKTTKGITPDNLLEDITPDDLGLPVLEDVELKSEQEPEISENNLHGHETVTNVPNVSKASNTEELLIKSMLNELDLDAFLEPLPEEEILTSQVSKIELNSTKSNQVLSRRNSLKENLLQPNYPSQSPPRISPDIFDFEPSAKKPKLETRPESPKELNNPKKSNSIKTVENNNQPPSTSLRAKLLARTRCNSSQPQIISPKPPPTIDKTPTKSSNTFHSADSHLTKSYEKSPSLFDIYLRNTRRLARRRELSASLSSSLKSDSIQQSAVADNDDTVIVRKPTVTSKRKIFDSDSEEDDVSEKKQELKTKDLTAIQLSDNDSSSEEIAPSQQRTSGQHRKKRRRLHCSFVEQEAAVTGSDVSEDEADYTLGHFMYDSVVVPNDAVEEDAHTSHMQAMYLQSLKSPANRRGAFKIPAFKVYNDREKIFSQAVPVESSQYVTNSFVVDEDDVSSINVEQSLCPLERAERILKERKRAKRKYAQIARTTTRRKNTKISQINDSSESDDDADNDDFEH